MAVSLPSEAMTGAKAAVSPWLRPSWIGVFSLTVTLMVPAAALVVAVAFSRNGTSDNSTESEVPLLSDAAETSV
jgi:hypothetical protein